MLGAKHLPALCPVSDLNMDAQIPCRIQSVRSVQHSAAVSSSSVACGICSSDKISLIRFFTASPSSSDATTTWAVRAFWVVLSAQIWRWCISRTPSTCNRSLRIFSAEMPAGTPSSDKRRLSRSRFQVDTRMTGSPPWSAGRPGCSGSGPESSSCPAPGRRPSGEGKRP